jgi:hypothetical protein
MGGGISPYSQTMRNQSFPGTITSNQIHTALKDRPDVRDFSAGGQAKNLKMCARVCEEWKKDYISKVRALGFNGELLENRNI